MMELNDVKVVGNLVAKPELKFTLNGTAVANISLGVNERSTVEGEERQRVAFVDATVWGKSAENFAKVVNKGTQIFLEGSLRQDKYTDQSGRAQSRLFINASRWQFVQKLSNSVAQVPEPVVGG
jgi:single-strand DNA-binding protein